MSYVKLEINDNIATIAINRPKVNALNNGVVNDINTAFENILKDDSVKVVILKGQGSFFSFGFDVPGFMSYSKEDFHSYVNTYCDLIKKIFMYPKMVIAALNGHTIAGGCVLSLACDYRIMVSDNAKIALNEMTFGSTLFSCVTETLNYAVGFKNAEQIIYSGKMHSAKEALELGLVDKIVSEDEFEEAVNEFAHEFTGKDTDAFSSIKRMLKQETLYRVEKYEKSTISEFVDIWYSKSTRKQLAKIEIRN